MNTKTAAVIIGIVFIVVGILGFTDNPIIGTSHDAVFHADSVHNSVHIVSGALFLLIAFAAPGYAAIALKVFGVVYFLLGLMGLINIGSSGMGQLLGFLHVNGPDNFLHIALGIVIFLAGMLPAIQRSTGR